MNVISYTILYRSATSDTPFSVAIEYSGSIQYMEHIVVIMSVSVADSSFAGARGDIHIQLTSPSGTISTLLSQRILDESGEGYYDWPFMSVMFWGEDPTGEWNLVITSRSSNTQVDVSDVEFQFFGVSNTPESVANIPNECHPDCERDCANEGSSYCDACINLRDAYTLECIETCPVNYLEQNGYCYDPDVPIEVCYSPLKVKEEGEVLCHKDCCSNHYSLYIIGSCVAAGYVGCCTDGDCEVVIQTSPLSCFCDTVCYIFDDCCDDIALIGCYPGNSKDADLFHENQIYSQNPPLEYLAKCLARSFSY